MIIQVYNLQKSVKLKLFVVLVREIIKQIGISCMLFSCNITRLPVFSRYIETRKHKEDKD